MNGPTQLFPFGIDDVVSLLGLSRQMVRQEHYLVNCPFCLGKDGQPDQHYHMDINTRKNTFHCNRCDAGGGMLALYAEYHHISTQRAYGEITTALFDSDTTVSRSSNLVPQPIICDRPASNLAPIEIRDQTYRHLLQALCLNDTHAEGLIHRGLSLDAIRLNGYRSLPTIGLSKIANQLVDSGCTLSGVPGFYRPYGQWKLDVRHSGLLIPVRDHQQRIQGLQIRRDQYVRSKYTWLTSSDQTDGTAVTSAIHIVGLSYALKDKTACITEGPLKADTASFLAKRCFIACPGTSHYKRFAQVLPILKWYGITEIYNAFDMDFETNPQVAKHIQEANRLFMAAGFTVKRLIWPKTHKGVDDYLLYMTTQSIHV